jgi:hydroxymethylglutaryl-CoA lyase
MQDAIDSGVKEVAVFAAATESFSKSNINCTIEESFERFEPVMALAKKHKIKVRGYLSVCFGCPFEGAVPEKRVIELAKKLYKMGCYEISIGDTIGVADPAQVASLIKKLKKAIPVKKIAGHFHDTRGTSLANILTAYNLGVRVFDASLGGLGGCPYAPGSSGNVATEDVVYMFDRMGVDTGLDLGKYIETNHWMGSQIKKELCSKVSQAGLPKS